MSEVAHVTALPTATGDVSVPAGSVIQAISLYETGGLAAVAVVIRDGGASGPLLGVVSVAAAGGATLILDGIRSVGIPHLTKVGTGVIEGSIAIR